MRFFARVAGLPRRMRGFSCFSCSALGEGGEHAASEPPPPTPPGRNGETAGQAPAGREGGGGDAAMSPAGARARASLPASDPCEPASLPSAAGRYTCRVAGRHSLTTATRQGTLTSRRQQPGASPVFAADDAREQMLNADLWSRRVSGGRSRFRPGGVSDERTAVASV